MNYKNLLKILLVVSLIIMSAGCVSETSEEESQPATEPEEINDDVDRYIDREAGVVCYQFRDGGNAASVGGISCVPINETTL